MLGKKSFVVWAMLDVFLAVGMINAGLTLILASLPEPGQSQRDAGPSKDLPPLPDLQERPKLDAGPDTRHPKPDSRSAKASARDFRRPPPPKPDQQMRKVPDAGPDTFSRPKPDLGVEIDSVRKFRPRPPPKPDQQMRKGPDAGPNEPLDQGDPGPPPKPDNALELVKKGRLILRFSSDQAMLALMQRRQVRAFSQFVFLGEPTVYEALWTGSTASFVERGQHKLQTLRLKSVPLQLKRDLCRRNFAVCQATRDRRWFVWFNSSIWRSVQQLMNAQNKKKKATILVHGDGSLSVE